MSFARGLPRRSLLAGTVAAGLPLGKPRAGELQGVGALQVLDAPRPIAVTFTAADGTARSLAEYGGRGVVLNLWATWCVPCVAEMPSLDAFARGVAAEGIDVLPLSSDRAGAPAVQSFYAEHDIRSLPVLLDPHSAAAHAMGVRGIPTTFIVDRTGHMVAWLEGTLDWSAYAAVEKIRALVGKPVPVVKPERA